MQGGLHVGNDSQRASWVWCTWKRKRAIFLLPFCSSAEEDELQQAATTAGAHNTWICHTHSFQRQPNLRSDANPNAVSGPPQTNHCIPSSSGLALLFSMCTSCHVSLCLFIFMGCNICKLSLYSFLPDLSPYQIWSPISWRHWT